ncbi:hypothetical protein FSP39_016070 [Pinctada imbricata]|uniref:Uncharacterized protein n=1 Tax=Pinctada imbricata TaxID=66713 RepID=A0AA89BNQ1_PINIB|nr:hypothetical protein FSP39_016070 [Pinctada imbricata]
MLFKSKLQYMAYEEITRLTRIEELFLVPECRIQEFLEEEELGLLRKLSSMLEISRSILSPERTLKSSVIQKEYGDTSNSLRTTKLQQYVPKTYHETILPTGASNSPNYLFDKAWRYETRLRKRRRVHLEHAFEKRSEQIIREKVKRASGLQTAHTLEELEYLKPRLDYVVCTKIKAKEERRNQYPSISRYTLIIILLKDGQYSRENDLLGAGEMVRSVINSLHPGLCTIAIPAIADVNVKRDCILVMLNDESQRPGRIDITQYTEESFPFTGKIESFNFCISTDEPRAENIEGMCENIDDLQKIIERYSQELIFNHSNIEVIRIGHKSINDTSVRTIEINCQHKGYIPFGEEKFPSALGGYPVSVKEAYLSDASNLLCLSCKGEKISNEHDSCSKYGSLGPFVSNGTDSFLTCAHVVCDLDELLHHISMDQGSILQTIPNRSKTIFHHVSERKKFARTRAVWYGDVDWNGRACGVDMAVAEVLHELSPTNKTEARKTGLKDWPCYSLSEPICNSCKATDLVYKCGGTTGLTVGKLQVQDGSDKVYLATCTSRFSPQKNGSHMGAYAFKNQYEIASAQKGLFADVGDSGSTLFVYNEEEKAIRPVGMITKTKTGSRGSGCRTTDCVAYATPIEALEIALKEIDPNYSFLTLDCNDLLQLTTPVKCMSSEI